jgi:hypothetical protein
MQPDSRRMAHLTRYMPEPSSGVASTRVLQPAGSGATVGIPFPLSLITEKADERDVSVK